MKRKAKDYNNQIEKYLRNGVKKIFCLETGEVLSPFYLGNVFENEDNSNQSLIRIRKISYSAEYINQYLKPFDNGYLNVLNN